MGGIHLGFQDKVVIVTGGAQGIGMAVSLRFAQQGATVVIVDIDEQAGQEHLQKLKASAPAALFIRADVANEQEVQRVARDVLDHFGRIDILVNNAGIFDTQSLFARPMDAFDRILAVNLRGPYMMAKYCGEALMEALPGVIINIASTRALMSEPDTEPYAAAKGGIAALTHALAVSLGPKVRVNAISPGWIEVADWRKQGAGTQPNHRPQDLAQHPVGRIGTPEDIAAACLYLADEKAGFITGANLVVDGGMTVKMIYEE